MMSTRTRRGSVPCDSLAVVGCMALGLVNFSAQAQKSATKLVPIVLDLTTTSPAEHFPAS